VRHEIDENVLKEAAEITGPDSNFHKILVQGLEIRNTGLTPVYFYDDVLGAIEITTEEKVSNKLN
jgi:hypothetical protein